MYNPNWPVHAAKELGCDHYPDRLPPAYAWWLKRREQIRALTQKKPISVSGDEG